MIRRSKHEWLVGILISVGIIVTVIAIYLINGFEWVELRTYDARFNLRGPQTVESKIILVLNDEETAQRLGKSPTKISRSDYAQAIKHLNKAGAKIIAFDMIFSGQQSFEEDSDFEQAMKNAKNVVLSRYITEGGHITPLERFQAMELGEGMINVALDQDGTLRSMPLLGFSYTQGELIPYLTLSAEVARLIRNNSQEENLDLSKEGILSIGSLNIPYPQGKLLINFFGPAGTFPSIPLWKAIIGDLAPEEIKGKIVVVGGQAATLHDYFQTPFAQKIFQPLLSQKEQAGYIRMMGAEVHAHTLMTILQQSYISRSSQWTTMLLILGLGIFGLLFMMILAKGPLLITLLWTTLFGLTVGGAYILFVYGNYWLEVVPLLATINGLYGGGMAYQRYILKREQGQLLGIFSGSLSPNLVKIVWENRNQFLHHERPCIQNMPVTTLVASCTNLNFILNHLTPPKLMTLTNEIGTKLTQAIVDFDGIVEESTPEHLKAVFGVPEKRTTESQIRLDAQKAVDCALVLKKEINHLQSKWNLPNLPTMHWQIIINTETVTTGIFGQFPQAKYRTLGQTLSLAHQIDQWEKTTQEVRSVPCQIMMTDSTFQYVHMAIDPQYMTDIRNGSHQGNTPIYRAMEDS